MQTELIGFGNRLLTLLYLPGYSTPILLKPNVRQLSQRALVECLRIQCMASDPELIAV